MRNRVSVIAAVLLLIAVAVYGQSTVLQTPGSVARFGLPAGFQQGGEVQRQGSFPQVVAGIDPDLVGHNSSFQRQGRIKMYVGDDGSVYSLLPELLTNGSQAPHFPFSLCGEPDQLGPGACQPEGLGDGSFHIRGGRIGHGLYPNRQVPSQFQGTDFNRS